MNSVIGVSRAKTVGVVGGEENEKGIFRAFNLSHSSVPLLRFFPYPCPTVRTQGTGQLRSWKETKSEALG